MTNAPEIVEDFLMASPEAVSEARQAWPNWFDDDKCYARIHLAVRLSRWKKDASVQLMMYLANEVNALHAWVLSDQEVVDCVMMVSGGLTVSTDDHIHGDDRYRSLKLCARRAANLKTADEAYFEVQRLNRYCHPAVSDKMIRFLVEEARHDER